MMKKLLISLKVLLGLVSCTSHMEFADENMGIAAIPAERRGSLQIRVEGSANAGATVDVFVYDDDQLRRLDTYQREVLGSDRIKVASTSGPKIVSMLINGRTGRYSWTASNTYSYMEKLDAEFERESILRPTLSGYCKAVGKSGKDCRIDLQPIMSKVVLRSIRCDFSGMAYDGARLTGAKVYLTNVSSICRMMQEKDFRTRGTLNSGMLIEQDLDRIEDRSMLLHDLPINIGKDWIEVNRTMYCYPNTNEQETAGSPFTRMVIEGKINDKTWYYPININRDDICWVEGTPGVSRNRQYIYDVTIKRTGTDDPDKPVSLDAVSVVCEIEPWIDCGTREERF